MKSIVILAALIAASVGCSGSTEQSLVVGTDGLVEIAVDFKDNAGWEQIQEADRLTGLDLEPNSVMFSSDKITVARVAPSRVAAVLAELSNDDDVETAEVSQIYTVEDADFVSSEVSSTNDATSGTPNDKWYPKQQWHMDMVGTLDAWKTTKGRGVIVAVLDTGVADGTDAEYPRVGDLANTKVLRGYDFTKNRDGAPDLHGHGSHVASTIAESSNNEIGGIGEAPEATILPVRVLGDNGSGSTAGIADGVRYAVDNHADIINLSLGGGGHSKILEGAMKYAKDHGVLAFCAAGNTPSEEVHYPSAYDGCFAVSAVGPGGKLGTKDASNPKTAQLATYSSFGGAGGKKGLFLAGPGGDKQRFGIDGAVWQSTIADAMGGGRPNPKKWSMVGANGTSMATPSVAGVAALAVAVLKEKNGGKFSYKQAEQILTKSAIDRSDKKHFGNGIVNAANAVKVASSSELATNDAAVSSIHWLRWILGALAIVAGFVFLRSRRS